MSNLFRELIAGGWEKFVGKHEIAYRLAAIVESSDDAIVSIDLDAVVVTWNKGAERLFGYTAEEIIGKPISTIIPADRQNEEPFLLDKIQHDQPTNHYDTVRMRKDGSLVDISLSISPIKDEQGKIVGASKKKLRAMLQNVSARRNLLPFLVARSITELKISWRLSRPP